MNVPPPKLPKLDQFLKKNPLIYFRTCGMSWVRRLGPRVGPIWPFSENALIFKNLLYSHNSKKICMHKHDVHETLFMNYEIHGPWFWSLCPKMGANMAL